MTTVRDEYAYYRANQAALARDYPGKVVTIKAHCVIGVHDNVADAYADAVREHEVGTFLLQEVCEQGQERIPYISRLPRQSLR